MCFPMRAARAIRVLALLIVPFLPVQPAAGTGAPGPKHIFLFIGDGMGFEQVRLADRALKESDGSTMRMTRLPVAGQIHTHSANQAITDSGAAATALACGVKTNNGMIGQLPDGTPVEPVSRKLLGKGMMIGILTSVTANHATPAPFYSHAGSRNQYEDIGMQFVDSGLHFLAGRGLAGGEVVADRIRAAYSRNGIAVVTDFSKAADVPGDRRMALLAPSLGSPHRRAGDLADATALAIERMKDNPAGFFLMIEGGAIDGACHGNRGWACIEETLALDRAVEVAYRFYLEHPETTLIVITADHETGGLAVHEDRLDLAGLREMEQRRRSFDAAIPADAAEITLEGVLGALEEHFGITGIPDPQGPPLEQAIRSGNRGVVVRLAMNVAQARAGITWSTGGHTGVDVPVYAVGSGAERFRGAYDMTRIPAKILELASGGTLPAE